ncbi:(Fe-S)-binding protein [bacterium]|nr:(Fe-S)-binding protein [candidate division CSSED10-310 bacterium]
MQDKYIDLETLKQEMLTCTMCGFCKQVCPVFLDVGWDTGSPRGRMTMAYGLITGEFEPDETFRERIFQCTQCTDCYRRCPSSAKCPDVVLAARRELVRRGFINPAQTKLVENVCNTGNIFADLDVEFPEQNGEIPLFIGCQHLSRPNNTKKTIKLLQALKIYPKIIREVCCGFPLAIMGFEKEHQEQKSRLESIFPMNGDPMITFCPSCLMHLKKEYGQPVQHVLQIINNKLDDAPLDMIGKTVTYHDPCDLSRGAGVIDEPREILRKIGCDLREMTHVKKESRCCGGGGGILTWDESLSDRMGMARIAEAVNTGAEMIVTSCPTCEQTLKKSARNYAEKNSTKPLPVRHILDLVIKAIK